MDGLSVIEPRPISQRSPRASGARPVLKRGPRNMACHQRMPLRTSFQCRTGGTTTVSGPVQWTDADIVRKCKQAIDGIDPQHRAWTGGSVRAKRE